MEAEPWEAEGYNLVLDSDLYDADGYDVPDPGLLTEKNELTFTEPSQVLPFLTSSQQWQILTPRARARRLWLLLRTSLHEVVEKEKRAELRVARLTHGLEPLRRLEVAAGLRSVAQDPVGGRFVVLDGAGRLHLHKEDGWAQETLLAPVGLTGLVTVLGPLGAVGRFVGWGPAGLAILRPNLSLLWLSEQRVGRAPGWAPTCCLPVPDLRLLLVAEMDSSLALWQFRSGGRRLVLRGSPLHPPPSPTGRLMRLAVGPVPPHHILRCFAAYGSAVLTFDLHAWTLVDVRRDLHKTTISDLAYCEEVEAMVTASRDSTVKVWEANWQIRMVFVGHTGALNSLHPEPRPFASSRTTSDAYGCCSLTRPWVLSASNQDEERYAPGTLAGGGGRALPPAFSLAIFASCAPCTDGFSVYLLSAGQPGGISELSCLLKPEDCGRKSLSLLRNLSFLLLPGPWALCAFEDPDSATYGLVQFGLGDSPRLDHRPQDDPTDHITGLCCCPALKLYACSSLDCTVRIWTAENRLLRLLQLNGAPQALAFCSNSGDLVLALESRLCLVSHRLYLPTSYLVKKMCWKVPDMVDDPPLPLTSQESLTSTQLQRLSNLHGAASLRSHTGLLNPPGGPTFPPWDLDALVARDRDLQQLRLGLLAPAARPPPSWQQRQEGFDNYLRLIYGSGLLGMQSGRESQQWSTGTLTVDRETWDVCALPQAAHCLACGELLAHSSLSHYLGLSLDLQLQLEQLRGRPTIALDLPSSHLQCRIPLLPKRQPKEPLSSLGGFFPAAVQPHKYCLRPICFPGYVPNSVVLQQMWLNAEPGASQDALWLQHPRPSQAQWQRKLLQWLGEKPGEEEEKDQKEEEEKEEVEEELDRASASLSLHSSQQLDSWELEDQSAVEWTREPRRRTCETARTHPHHWHRHGSLLLDEHYGHLPKFLHFFIYQTWFKELFPVFNLQAYPEAGTVEGLASLLVALLEETTWVDRVHILQVLLRLLPNISSDLQGQLQGLLIYLLNLDQPPSLQDQTQKKFVILAMQLLLACSLESRDVVLELMSYFLYSPVRCRPELKKLLHRLGLQDPEGFLFQEMMTWVQSPDLDSKAGLRTRCCQKLEDMIQQLQETPSQTSVVSGAPTRASVVPLGTSWSPSGISGRLSQVSEVPLMVVSPAEPPSLSPELQAQRTLAPTRSWGTRQLRLGVLSETLKSFCLEPEAGLSPAGPAQLPEEPPLLEETDWSHSQLLDLGPIDALNFFCQQLRARRQRARQQSSLQEEAAHSRPLWPDGGAVPDMVVPPTPELVCHPILRLQEAKAQRSARSAMRLRGPMPSRLCAGRTLDGPIRTLKLPLPRVEPQPFPRDWPTPPRPLPPRLLQPALQRYFLPEDADPDTYS
ncbi:PREDICTED: LOW QUALITY PROTEIN: WD repeat-containing protein 97 [Rhinopithecus bieti]|uniref:LOW QUALITY PROTEIN: WD repeat-containing protein 97 n=1 Tax=Rhinopithecus bieti TaxID=61621 RepID=UPI00083C6FE9|nr:PREDICTED: LOW QUALITY PROTEIN: WD repeat-containing protein 97 [Rhinopithecus bieti]